MPIKVSVKECKDYDPDKVYFEIKAALSEIGYVFKPGLNVLIKPNLLSSEPPEKAVTTHPAVLDAVCRILKENKCHISVGESRGFYRDYGTQEAFKVSGLWDIAKKHNAKIIIFEKEKVREIKDDSSAVLKEMLLSDYVLTADLVINLPKLKTHSFQKYTGAVKNLYGCVPGAVKQKYHMHARKIDDFADLLLDIYLQIKPGLNIMDAIVGLEGQGPGSTGKPKATGLIIASENALALDIVASKIIGFVPKEIPVISQAIKRGLIDIDDVCATGKDFHVNYRKPLVASIPPVVDKIVFNSVYVFPQFDKEKCVRCGICKSVCPAKAINMSPYPGLDKSRCIRCYCCHEMCPHSAIELKRSMIIRALSAMRRAVLAATKPFHKKQKKVCLKENEGARPKVKTP